MSDVYPKMEPHDESRIMCDIIEKMTANDLLAAVYEIHGGYESLWNDLTEHFADKIDAIYEKEMTGEMNHEDDD